MKYIKLYESFDYPINESKITDFVKSLLLKGVLPSLIVLQLSKMIGNDRAIATVADIIENYDGASLYNKEVLAAKNIAKEKCKKFPNKDFLIKKIDEIPVRMGEIKSKIGTTGAQFPEEIFVRIQGLRNYMFEIGILKNINSEISEDNLNELIDYHKNNDKASLIQFEKRDVLYLLSLIKIKGFSKKINKIASINNNVISDLT